MATRIEKQAALWHSVDAVPGYEILMVVIPPGTGGAGLYGNEFDDRSIEPENTHGSLWMRVHVERYGGPVAVATFAATDEAVRCCTIDVLNEHRRIGIATALYDLAEEVFGVEAQPSATVFDDGVAFWETRRMRRQERAVVATRGGS